MCCFKSKCNPKSVAHDFREAIRNALNDAYPGMDIRELYNILNQNCPLDVDPTFNFTTLTTKQLRDLQRYYRNPTPAKQSHVALQYGIHATIAMAVKALNEEVERRSKAKAVTSA